MRLIFTTKASTFEKINIPISNLVVGKKYKLYFSQDNDATITESNNYGCTILNTQTTQTISVIPSLLWSPTTQTAIKKSINQTITFIATAKTMYWTWDFSKLADGTESNFKIYDIYLAKI